MDDQINDPLVNLGKASTEIVRWECALLHFFSSAKRSKALYLFQNGGTESANVWSGHL
jgi:hypothetical protein